MKQPLTLFFSFCLALTMMLGGPAVARTSAPSELPEFTWMVETYGPAVVNISTTSKSKRKLRERIFKDLPEDSPFHDFFRHFFEERGGGGPDEEEESDEPFRSSLGSGFIISTDGYVLTNSHVVEDADEIVVRLNDRRELEAELIGADQLSDIALLKVEAENLPAVKFGSSTDLKVGEWVLAIGSPFGFDNSATAGIISALGRSLPGSESNYVPFIQTDVAINPGNSGGPLFNLDGKVVGVNSQIYTRSGGFMGLSFAIPSDMVLRIVDQLKDKGKVSRGWLGVMIQDVTRELAESFGMEKPQGALVAKVLPDGPAKDAGFEVGDIIIRFNGRDVDYSSDLPPIVGTTPVGEKVEVRVIRGGEQKTIQVEIGELPAPEEMKLTSRDGKIKGSSDKLGLEVSELAEEEREALEIAEGGVKVEEVEAGPARQAGVRPGDVILMLDRKKIKDVNHFRELVNKLEPGKVVPVLVHRRNAPVFLALRIPKE